MASLQKSSAKLGGVALAATSGIAWRFVGGVQPYTTTFSVHKDDWGRLQGRMGQPLPLEIIDSRGVVTKIEQVYILHVAPSDSPHRVTFVVADKRWKWPYQLVVRDYNVPRKTGDRTAFGQVPVETQTVVDAYDYLPYSLKGEQGERWTAKDAVEDVLELLEPETGAGAAQFRIESFPIKDTAGSGTAGEFTLQGVMLRDSGDVALGRMLSYVPGADVYIDEKGVAVIYDATDLDATENYFRSLPVSTYAGDRGAWVDRVKIRPAKVVVHYQREVEMLFEYSDDYSGATSAQLSRSAPFIENVCPTVDPVTNVAQFNPQTGQTSTAPLRPGTWVEFRQLLAAWDADRPEGSLPWTFDTIRRHWLKGDLEAVLGARGLDLDTDGNIAMRVQAIRQHFRQTFRINKRYTERFRSLRAVRVGLLDPVTGARAPAAVWGQACIIPSRKGTLMAARGTDELARLKLYRNVDFTPQGGESILERPPGPTRVVIVDEELGIFRTEWITSPYGTVESFIPCKLVGDNGNATAVTRDLSKQDTQPMGPAMLTDQGTNGIFLAPRMTMYALMTVVPTSPNDERQFHRVEVDPRDVASVFRKEFRIAGGQGPEMHVFAPPGEATARFALADQDTAFQTVQQLLGLLGDGSGIDGVDLPGYVLSNEQRYLTSHALSLATELLTPYADNVQGAIVTEVPTSGAKLVGNMASATVRVAPADGAKVDLVSAFPGQQRQISRLAVMPESTRQIVLGIVPFRA